MDSPLISSDAYQKLIYGLAARYPSVARSTLTYVPSGALFGRVEGMLIFAQGLVLCVHEYLNFELGIIEGYGYEVSQAAMPTEAPGFPAAADYCQASYPNKKKLYWYDSFPHPNDPSLARTHPHHKHMFPDIKHHRVPAPELSFTRPNLPFLIDEVTEMLHSDNI
jgi:hypothetical protein